jgi:CheY-like chemotaxis protein
MRQPETVTGDPDIVLIIDDEPTVRTILERFVRAASDYQPIAVASAPEGYQRLTELYDRVALLLLDMSMNGMDGFAFRERQLAGPAADVPTVVCSGRVLDADDVARLRPAATLQKPVHLAALRECIERNAHAPKAGAQGGAV